MRELGHGPIKIFAGNGSQEIAKKICEQLNLPLGEIEVSRFSDGEINVNIKETVRGCEIFVIQSTSTPVNDNLMELMIITDAAKRASARSINAVIPYFGYARQDRKSRARDPISAKLVADILQTAGVDRVVTMDLHCLQLQGFFDIPVDNLFAMNTFVKYFNENGYNTENLTVVSPDVGSVARSRSFAKKFDAPLAIIDKRRPKANEMEVMNIIGDVSGKVCLMMDDMIDTGGTICRGAQALINNGAKEVVVCCTHPVFSGKAVENLQNSVIKKVIVTDTIQLPETKKFPKLEIISVSKSFAEVISRIYTDKPVSKLFE